MGTQARYPSAVYAEEKRKAMKTSKKSTKTASKTAKRAPVFAPTTFGQSLKDAKSLLSLIDSGKLTSRQLSYRVDKFMVNSDTVRGFCIMLLTGDYRVSDNPPAAMVKSMRNGSDAVFEVMAKNVVMAPTMAVTHRRNQDEANAKASDKSTERTIKLIHLIDSAKMTEQLNAMKESFLGKPAAFLPFVKQWKYDQDSDQIAAGIKALDSALKA